MVEHGRVTEGTTSTALIVYKHGKLITRPLTNPVLPGVTRLAVLDLIDEAGLGFEERTFSVEEAYEATEAFLTSASTFVAPVVEIDGHRIGQGRPGLFATRLRELYVRRALDAAE
jgi:D-alanine transaminase